jgi:hypothetical protein
MAIVMDWEKRKPKGLDGFKNREMLWLWCKLERVGYKLNPDLVGDLESRANHLIDRILEADAESVGNLREFRDECFSRQLDESEFKWIVVGDERLKHWLIETLTQYSFDLGVVAPPFDQSGLRCREQVCLAFDLSDALIQVKRRVMSDIRRRWSENIEINPALDWISKNDEAQCRWLVDEIRQSDVGPWISQNLQSSVSNEDRLLLFANALDRVPFPPRTKKLFLKDLKSKWSKKSRKAVAAKVQCNLNVDPEIKRYIKESAKNRAVKMGEYVELLVAEEIERKKKTQGA